MRVNRDAAAGGGGIILSPSDLGGNTLVVRKVFDGYRVSVEYTVSPYGKTLKPLVGEMIN